MKKLFLLGVLFSVFLVCCDDTAPISSVGRDYKVRDIKTGSVSFRGLDNRYQVGDTVYLPDDKITVTITDIISKQ